MAGSKTVIELGSDWSFPPDVAAHRPGSGPRRWYAAGVLAVLLLALAGERPAPSTGLVRYAEAAIGRSAQFHLVDDFLLVIDGTEARTYHLADGRLRGTATIPRLDQGVSVLPEAGLIWIHGFEAQTSHTVVLGPDGDLRWKAPGSYQLVADAGLVLATRSVNLAAGQAADHLTAVNGTSEVTVRDLATGAVRWQARDAGPQTYDTERRLVVSLTRDGFLIERSVADGTVVRRAPLTVPGTPTYFDIDGDVLAIHTAPPTPPVEGATLYFDLSTLATITRPSGPADSRMDWPCQPYRCAILIVGGEFVGTEVADPGSGRVLFSVDGTRGIAPVPPGILVLSDLDTTMSYGGTLVDPLTGQTRLDVTPWSWMHGSLSGVMHRPVPSGKSSHIGWLTAGGVQPRGILPSGREDCKAAFDVLVCLEPAGLLSFWRVGH